MKQFITDYETKVQNNDSSIKIRVKADIPEYPEALISDIEWLLVSAACDKYVGDLWRTYLSTDKSKALNGQYQQPNEKKFAI